jgi:molecular chaperone GrpE
MSKRNESPASGRDRSASPPPARPPDPPAAGAGHEPGPGADGTTAEGGKGEGGMPSQSAARIAELEDQRLRALADLDNLRKKCVGQVSAARAETRAEVTAQWLPVVDNLERALAHSEADPGSIVEGIKAVREQAMNVLAQLGYPRRDDLGSRFDPARHEAVASRSDEAAPAGSVVEVILPAYGEAERQLRPARVVVAKAD